MKLEDIEALVRGKFVTFEKDDGEYVPGEIVGLYELGNGNTLPRLVVSCSDAGVQFQPMDQTMFSTRESCEKSCRVENGDDDVPETPSVAA